MGCGKTSLLRHLNWKINKDHHSILQMILDLDSTWKYWNINQDLDGNILNLNKNNEVTWFSDKDKVPLCPTYLCGLYIDAIDLLQYINQEDDFINMDMEIDFETILKSSYSTFIKEDNERSSLFPFDKYIESYKKLIENHKLTAIYLFIDSFDIIHSKETRNLLLNLLFNTVQSSTSNIFRIFISSRPNGLFKCDNNIIEKIQFFYIDHISNERAHDMICKSSNYASNILSGDISVQKRIIKRMIRLCDTPLLLNISIRLIEKENVDIYSNLFCFYESVIKYLETSANLNEDSFKIGKFNVSRYEFDQLIGLCVFFIYCWSPIAYHESWSVGKKIRRLLHYIINYHHEHLENGILSDLRNKYIEEYGSNEEYTSIKYEIALKNLCRDIWNASSNYLNEIKMAKFYPKYKEKEGVNPDITLTNTPLAQFIVSRFLSDDDFSSQIFNAIKSSRNTLIDFEQTYPSIFDWNNGLFLTSPPWNYIFDLICSKLGVVWLSTKILDEKYTIFEWLTQMRLERGIDLEDLGQIRFYRLLKGFSIQLENSTLNAEVEALSSNQIPSSNEEVIIANLKEAFGMTFVSILGDNPSSIVHLEEQPITSLKCFSHNAITITIEKIIELLKQGTNRQAHEILLKLDQEGLIPKEMIDKILLYISSPKSIKTPLKSIIRFLSSRNPYYIHTSKIIECLACRDYETHEEIREKIMKNAKLNLLEVKKEFKSIFNTNIDNDPDLTQCVYTVHYDSPKDKFLFIYTNNDWDLLFRTAITLMTEFIQNDLHTSKKNNPYYTSDYPKARPLQCHRISTLISLMESESAGARLLPFILLGTTNRSNNFNKEEETRDIESSLIILEQLGKHYQSKRELSQSGAIDEFSNNNALNCAIGYIILDLLGEQAAKISLMIPDLIKSRLDFINALNVWTISQISIEKRRQVFYNLICHSNPYVQRDIIQLMSSSNTVLENIDTSNLSALVEKVFAPPDTPIFIRRKGLEFIRSSSLVNKSSQYRLHCIDKIRYLFGRFGFHDPVLTESLLGTLELHLENGLFNEQDGSISLLKISNFFMDAMEAFPKLNIWLAKISIGRIMKLFISYDLEGIQTYIDFFDKNIPELRRIAFEELSKVPVEIANDVFKKTIKLIDHKDPIVRTSYSTLLGCMATKGNKEMSDLVVQQALDHLSQGLPILVQQGVSILSNIGSNCRNYEKVKISLTKLLDEKVKEIGTHTQNKTEEDFLCQTLVHCIGKIGLCDEVIVSLLLNMLSKTEENGLKLLIYLTLKSIVPGLSDEQKLNLEEQLFSLLTHEDYFVRELCVKTIRRFGLKSVKHSISKVVKLISDPSTFPRKQALKNVSYILEYGDDNLKKNILIFSSAIVSALEDKNALVVIEALKVLGKLKKPKSQNHENEDVFIVHDQNILDVIIRLLNRKRFRNRTDVKIAVFVLLAETNLLQNHIRHFSDLLNSDDISVLYEFSDVFKRMGADFIQYFPIIISVLKPTNPLIRSFARNIIKHEKSLDYATCSRIFGKKSILTMMKNKDSNVRRVAVNLLGKKILEKPKKNLWLLTQMWSDKVNRIRKEVTEVLGDLGRKNPQLIPQIMELIDPDSKSSILTWRYLSKAWGVLISRSLDGSELT